MNPYDALHRISQIPDDEPDAGFAEAQELALRVLMNLETVAYQGKETAVPAISLQGDLVVTAVVTGTHTKILVLRLPAPIQPNEKASEGECGAATPILAINVPDIRSLDAVEHWILGIKERYAKVNGPMVATMEVGKDSNGNPCTLWRSGPGGTGHEMRVVCDSVEPKP